MARQHILAYTLISSIVSYRIVYSHWFMLENTGQKTK